MADIYESFLREVFHSFIPDAKIESTERYGSGHINDTFRVTAADRGQRTRYILQRISTAAFKAPDRVMRNIVGITEYLHGVISAEGGDPTRETLTVIRTADGMPYYIDNRGEFWRMYLFIEDTVCLQQIGSSGLFRAAAEAFGRFSYMLRDYPAADLFETIERFHDSENRLRLFRESVNNDRSGRAGEVREEIDFIERRAGDLSVCMQALRDGVLPLRVTHNDTKLNNVLFDRDTMRGLCVIDLDTVMPGLICNDFGDAIRFGANHSAEDERDLSLVNFDLELYRAYTAGFFEGTGGTLTKAETDFLPWGARLMTLECGMRFLTDHIDGDRYFHIAREGQNLDRARTQFKLVSDMERSFDDMRAIVNEYK